MSRRLGPWLLILVVTFILPESSTAQARIPITWEVPPGLDCMTLPGLVREVETRLREPFDLELEVHGRAERSSTGVRATLVLRTQEGAFIGTRTVEAEGDCHHLDDALPVVIAMMLNVPRENLSLFVRARPVEEPPQALPELADPVNEISPRAGNEITASGALVVGALPDVALGTRLMSVVVVDGFSAFALDVLVVPEHVRLGMGGAITFRLMSVGVGTCAMGGLIEAWLRIEACAGIRVDALWVEPAGFDENRAVMTWMFGAELGGRGSFRLWGPLWVSVGLGVNMPLPPSVFAYRGPTGELHEIHRVAPLTGRLDLGLTLRFE